MRIPGQWVMLATGLVNCLEISFQALILGNMLGGMLNILTILQLLLWMLELLNKLQLITGIKITNKIIYPGYSEEFPVPNDERDSGGSYKQVWRRLCNPCLTSSAREILYLLVHNKLPVRERFFRIKVEVDPYCEYCLDITGAEICDVDHYFCSCSRVAETSAQ